MGTAPSFERFPWRRIAAFMIDWLILAAYISIHVTIVLTVARGRLHAPESLTDRVKGQLLAFAIVTGPLILYFALMKASRWQGTIGKRLSGLRVVDISASRPAFRWTLVRALGKFAPWEIAHTAIWHSAGRPFIDPPPTINMVVMVVAQLVALGYVVTLFVGSGRTPYDRISRTQVVRAS